MIMICSILEVRLVYNSCTHRASSVLRKLQHCVWVPRVLQKQMAGAKREERRGWEGVEGADADTIEMH